MPIAEKRQLGDRHRWLLAAAAGVVVWSAAVATFGAVAGFGGVVRAVRTAAPAWIGVCAAAEVVAYAGYVVAYRGVAGAEDGAKLGLGLATRVVLVGFGGFVLASALGGFAIDYLALRRAGMSERHALRRILALNALEWGTLAGIAAAAACASLLPGGDQPMAMVVPCAALGPVGFVAAACLTRPAVARRADGWLARRKGWRRRLGAAIGEGLAGATLARRLVARRVGALVVLALATYWCADMTCVGAALAAFGAHVDPRALVVAFATAYAVTAVPLPTSLVGLPEASLALALHVAGVPLAQAILAVLVYRVFTFWFPVAATAVFARTARALVAVASSAS